jgi:hypothetical protein
MDALMNEDSDRRISVIYASMACEVFIQDFLRRRAAAGSPLVVWLDWTQRTGNPVNIGAFYNVGLPMMGKPALSNNNSLDDKFRKLTEARNDLVHRGQLRKERRTYSPQQAIATAKEVIAWVESQ